MPPAVLARYEQVIPIFLAPEADDTLLLQEIDLVGEDQVLFASDVPHGEGRHNAASEILDRSDLSDDRKRKFLYDNTARFFGDP